MSRELQGTFEFWLLAVANLLLIPLFGVRGFSEHEIINYRMMFFFIFFVVSNICLVLGLITGCPCLFRPMMCFYAFVTLFQWTKAAYTLFFHLLPNIFYTLLSTLKDSQDTENDWEYQTSLGIQESLMRIIFGLVFSVVSLIVSAIFYEYQKNFKEKKESVDVEKADIIHVC